MATKKINVVLLIGGPSPEHDISLKSGDVIARSLDTKKYHVTPIVVLKNKTWQLPRKKTPMNFSEAMRTIKYTIRPDVAFIAMHGAYGEDGTVQGLLESAGIPYTGSGILASSLAMDKQKSSALFSYYGMKVPRFIACSYAEWRKNRKDIRKETVYGIGLPCIVKPTTAGSSIGITKVLRIKNLRIALKEAFLYSDEVMIQKCIQGTEITCSVLDTGTEQGAIPLSPTEIIPCESDFFDHRAKYEAGAAKEITPARLPEKVIADIQNLAARAHSILGCSGLSRTDMIVGKDGIYILETNTIPGMTETSLLPQAATAAGIEFPKLLDMIIQAGIDRRRTFDKK
jgi:D-alanine-D-alanine ligase